MSNQIVIYKSSTGQIKLKIDLSKQTLWLNQSQIANLYGTKRPAITKHLKNIFESKELEKKSVCSKMEHTAKDGKRYWVNFYNLDATISIGYRVNSQKATQFRIWATDILKKYITRGHVINQSRLKQLRQTIKLVATKSKKELLQGHETEIIDLMSSYSSSFLLLKQYDNKNIAKPKLKSKTKRELNTDNINQIISRLKKQFPKQTL